MTIRSALSRISPLIVWTILLLVIVPFASLAQDALTITLIDEQNIGYRCPEASVLQPGTDTLWVLIDDCNGDEMMLHAFDRNTGELIDAAVGAPFALDALNGTLYVPQYLITPLSFTADGAMEIIATSYSDARFARLQVDVATGTVTQDEEADAAFNALLQQYSEYPVYSTYFSGDHQLAAVGDEVSVRVVDLANETVLFEVGGAYNHAVFSSDNQRLYISTVDDYSDDDFDAAVSVYSVPDGELLASHPISTNYPLAYAAMHPSEDGRFVAAVIPSYEVGKESLILLDVETRALSAEFIISEDPRQVTTCQNDGTDVSDLDYQTTGLLTVTGLQWLADGSGFITLNSPGFQVGEGGCMFDYSRLRRYWVGKG